MRNELMMHFPISPNEKYIMQIGDDRTIPLFEVVYDDQKYIGRCEEFRKCYSMCGFQGAKSNNHYESASNNKKI